MKLPPPPHLWSRWPGQIKRYPGGCIQLSDMGQLLVQKARAASSVAVAVAGAGHAGGAPVPRAVHGAVHHLLLPAARL